MEELLVKTEILWYPLLTLATGLWLYWLWTRRNWYRFAFRFTCYFGLPILGIVNRIKHAKDFLQCFTELFLESKQNNICVWMGMYPVLVTSDPDLIEKILSSPELLDKSKVLYGPLYNGFRGGLLSSPAKEWYPHRKLINPSFNHKVIVSFFPIFHKAKKHILCKFDTLVGTGEHKLSEMIMQTTMRISAETTLGKVVKENENIYENAGRELLYLMQAVLTQITLNFVKLQWLFFFNVHYNKAKNYTHSCVHELIIHKLQNQHESETIRDQSETGTSMESDDSVLKIKKTPKIFIDQAIQIYHRQQFTWTDIIAESNTIVATSFDTIATVILSSIVMLAMHPDVQEKLYEEIVGVFPEKDFEMEYEHLEQLPYLDMVINETMRLAPAAPIIARQPAKDTQLTKDILLPNGLQIIISIFHLHRNKDIWGPNADKFNPDNFLPKNFTGKHTHAFIPFSKGPRNCIGWRYALFAMKVLLAGSVRNFRYTTTFRFEDLEHIENVTIKYLVEPGIKVHRR